MCRAQHGREAEPVPVAQTSGADSCARPGWRPAGAPVTSYGERVSALLVTQQDGGAGGLQVSVLVVSRGLLHQTIKT